VLDVRLVLVAASVLVALLAVVSDGRRASAFLGLMGFFLGLLFAGLGAPVVGLMQMGVFTGLSLALLFGEEVFF